MIYIMLIWITLIVLNVIISYFSFIKDEKYFTFDDICKFFVVFILLAPIGFLTQFIVLYEDYIKDKRFKNPLFKDKKYE